MLADSESSASSREGVASVERCPSREVHRIPFKHHDDDDDDDDDGKVDMSVPYLQNTSVIMNPNLILGGLPHSSQGAQA